MKVNVRNRHLFGSFATMFFGSFFVFQNCGPLGRALQPRSSENPVAVEAEECTPTGSMVEDQLEIVENPCEVVVEEPVDDNSGFEDIQGERGLAGSPTPPANFRELLVSNNWSELQWEPSEDADGTVESYVLYRDGKRLRRIFRSYQAGDYREAEKYWKTSTYMDCNYTRYVVCERQQPEDGKTYTYHLAAVDNEGKESELSNPIDVAYHAQSFARFNRQQVLSQYSLVFGDEFNGAPLDASRWVMRRPWDDPDGSNSPQKLINGEQQYLIDSQLNPIGFNPIQFYAEGGAQGLSILGTKTPPELIDEAQNQPYLSAMISSRRSFSFKYGYVEARFRPASLSGTISTFFLLNSQYQLGAAGQYGEPEIDILEFLGREPRAAFQTYHHSSLTEELEKITHSSPTQVHIATAGAFTDAFHTYAVLWEPGSVIWYIDDIEVRRLTGPEVSDEDMYIVFSLIIGSPWAQDPPAAGPFPTRYDIDYVKVYRKP